MNISYNTHAKNKKNILQYISIFMLLIAVALFSSFTKAAAQDVQLNPGYISGTVSIDGVTTGYANISAYSGSENASIGTSSGSYNLTVNTPTDGSSITYSVSAYARSDSNKDYLYFKSQSVAVTESNISTLDFNVNPGFVVGTVSVTGATLSYAYVYAYLNSGGNYTYAYTRTGSDGTFSFPVQPNSNIRIYGTAYMTSGANYNLGNKYVDLSVGQTVTQNYALTIETDTPGSIEGSIGINGIADIDRNYISASRSGGGSKSTSTTGNTYSLTDLIPGNWYLYPYAYLNNYDDYFVHPYSSYARPINVLPGSTVTQDIVTDAAFLNGTVSLSGSKGIQDLNYAYINMAGIYNTPAYGGNSRDNINLDNGDFDLILAEGDWSLSYQQYGFYNSDPYLSSSITLYDYSRRGTPVSLTAEQTINNHNLSYQTGTVTINFSALGDVTFSSPYISGSGEIRDENGVVQQRAYLSSYGSSGSTSVTVVGMPMLHDFTAYAYVNGSRTTFGKFTLSIQAGTDIVVDIGGPTLSVTNPTAELCTSDSSVTVSGTVTDDTEVAGVTVNGASVTLSPTNNPNDAVEVSFSTTVFLSSGSNSIAIVATDSSGKNASLTSSVYQDSGSPVIGDWTPIDGASTADATITVQGTATDDNEIQGIEVNGSSVTPVSTNNASDPNEVSFSTTVNLIDGDNIIEVEVSDNCNTTSETHTVTKGLTNRPPVAECSSVTVFAGTDCNADADVDNGSYDPDEDPITTSQSPEGPYGLGITVVTFTVTDDSGASDTCSTTVTVVDNTAPTISCPNNIAVDNDPGVCGAIVDYVVTGTDNCSEPENITLTKIVGPASGSLFQIGTTTVEYEAEDGAGNKAECSFTVTVTDAELDTDGDGSGDACDPDDDNDGVADDEDNCPLTVNADQTDTDSDGLGDACDPDDDNDGVADDEDNCPLTVNADQTDTDSDGLGDVCDPDDDNDGVLDEDDSCSGTATGEYVNSNGCSIGQQCSVDVDWRNHGQYVSCVSHAAEELLAEGVITEEEKDAIVSAAAGSSVGKSNKGKGKNK